jgi:hypothetical protein
MDGRAMPDSLEDGPTGWSTGRWEGDTLVVETSRISPTVRYFAQAGDQVLVGNDVRVTERFRVLDPEHLQVETTLVAPDVLTAPEKRKQVFQRAAAGYTPRQLQVCWPDDRAIDPVTGRQRLDLTPPPDLPPPPGD